MLIYINFHLVGIAVFFSKRLRAKVQHSCLKQGQRMLIKIVRVLFLLKSICILKRTFAVSEIK